MKLQEIRKSKNLTAKELSAKSGVPIYMIQKYEIGVRNIDGAKLETLCDLAIALDVSISDIVEDETLKTKLKLATKKSIR